ncbi:hypothetical protein [Sphingomonas sp.]|uniref:hypothetical protein n=1 Tax=Sphingomonas sp. TaxID=28214 RepID=UPI0025DDFD03|nr:hypothetical protein [Sphingomonas sp.]
MPIAPVLAPAGYVPEHAVAFGSQDGPAIPVDYANPLPTALTVVAATSVAITGTSAASTTVGPLFPQLGRAIWLTLGGTWTGTARLLRSIDGGTNRLPLTIGGQDWALFTGNCNEAVAEETVSGATYYLSLTIASGTVAYQVSQ